MKAMVLAGIGKIDIVERPIPMLQYPTDAWLGLVAVFAVYGSMTRMESPIALPKLR
jgi:hypothetical protein